MKLLGLGLNLVGFLAVAWGIARKSSVSQWIRGVRVSTKELWLSGLAKVRASPKVAVTLAKRVRAGASRAWQAIRVLAGFQKNAQGSSRTALHSGTSAGGVAEENRPTPDLNHSRIGRIEERLRSADDEAKYADALVLVGGLFAFLGNVVLVIWT